MSQISKVVNNCDKKDYFISTEKISTRIWETVIFEKVKTGSPQVKNILTLQKGSYFEAENTHKELESIAKNIAKEEWKKLYSKFSSSS